MSFKFENLKIWQDSLVLADAIDQLALSFPKHELYSLSSQIKRAADSVSLNIVEGSTGHLIWNLKGSLSLPIVQPWKLLDVCFLLSEEIIFRRKDSLNCITRLKYLLK